jgi:hypothetical protein
LATLREYFVKDGASNLTVHRTWDVRNRAGAISRALRKQKNSKGKSAAIAGGTPRWYHSSCRSFDFVRKTLGFENGAQSPLGSAICAPLWSTLRGQSHSASRADAQEAKAQYGDWVHVQIPKNLLYHVTWQQFFPCSFRSLIGVINHIRELSYERCYAFSEE